MMRFEVSFPAAAHAGAITGRVFVVITPTDNPEPRLVAGTPRSASGSSSEEIPLNWNKWARQTHRWLSIAFTVAVIVNIVAVPQKPTERTTDLMCIWWLSNASVS